MPGENLTRAEAQERRATVNVHLYDIALDLTTGDEAFRSTTVVTFDAVPGASTFIDAITRQVHHVELNGRVLDPADVSDGVRIRLDGLEAHNRLVVVADAVYMNTGEGLHRFVDPVDGEVYLYTQFEVPDSRRVFAVFEQPDLKAQFVFHVTAPSHWQVISNQPSPQPVPATEATSTWHFAPTPRISSYITAIVAGPYVSQHDSLVSMDGRTIPLGVYCRASVAEYLDAENIFTTTKRGFEYYEKNFNGPYPFEKYDQLFVPEFNAGAMENAGCVTFTETYVFRSKVQDAVRERRDVTILHELAHMWFGDLVTMRWWNDLWLNESFAEFISTIACAEATGWSEAWTTFNAMEKSWAYRQDQLPSTHPIVAEIRDLDDVLVNFDGITYAKGGSVLKQLFFWVGREAFFQGVSTYFRKHGWGNTELRDLLAELEIASGRDLSAWSRLWLETAGVNTLRPRLEVDERGVITSFAVEQTAVEEHPTLRPHRLAIGLFELHDGGEGEQRVLRRADRLELDVDGPLTEVPALAGRPRPAMILLNDDDLAYAKIRLDDDSLRVAVDHLASIESPLARSLVLSSVWDSTRDAETRPRDFIRLVLGTIGTETESTTRRTVLGQLATASKYYTDAEDREEILEVVTDELWALAEAAEPGSDAQFAFVKSFAGLAHTTAHLDVIDALFTQQRSLEGLEIDTDLGWELLIALVAGGRRTRADIDARLAEDNTADGQRAAAHAAAAGPANDDKDAAWQRVMVSSDAPNSIVRATAAGFSRGDDAVLEAFVDRYFEAIRGVWDSRSFHIAEELIEGFFPSYLPTEQVLAAATAWLDANTDAPDALRRIVIEGRAAVERSLRAQQRDAG
ncbi:aminopeptidase N [Pseudoclavibacter endophyticus]|uniref:Aminopeptidase N n=1 Tax=Pseudoclavibacter endophyticus TaxID=1778590 RepID=A0A6H9WA86_9MICO|nr:aminopeptidase N [Pseudoclavibacter endophyticus]KAB1646727.1 aminopeptidase N [Pseudoclavibacter endophyticus]GGA76062.1 aminopeptidase N [Pseudoclavibacter endophyticus]